MAKSSVSLTEAKQTAIVEELDVLYNLDPQTNTADACARIYRVIYPTKKFPQTPWGFSTRLNQN